MSAVLYPGSFDPVTKGHIDVIQRLANVFDRVVVLVADSPRKNYLFTRDERVTLIEEALRSSSVANPKAGQKSIEVRSSDQLTVSFAQREKIQVIARSVRTVADWEYEYAMADGNKKLVPEIETLFIMADPQYGFISSSLVREVAAFSGETSAFVPANVAAALRRKYDLAKS